MSFLTKTVPRILSTSVYRASVSPTTTTAAAAFTTSSLRQKSVQDSVKDGLKKVDRVVSDNVAIPAVDAVAAAKDKVKAGAEKVMHSDAAAKADNVKEDVKGKAKKVKDEAAGKAEEVKGEVKGKAEEVKGEVKGKSEEVKSKI